MWNNKHFKGGGAGWNEKYNGETSSILKARYDKGRLRAGLSQNLKIHDEATKILLKQGLVFAFRSVIFQYRAQ